MSKPSKRKSSKQKSKARHVKEQRRGASGTASNSSDLSAPTGNRLAWILGTIAMIISTVAAAMLVMQHFTGLGAPGCGPGSACAAAAESVWGKVPVIDWPVSFLGFAYFLAVLIVWIITRGVIGHLIWLVRLGAVISAAYVAIMLANATEYLCLYCMVSHVGNFAFLGIAEWTRRTTAPFPAGTALHPLGHAVAAMAGVSIVLTSWQFATQRSIEREADQALEESTAQIIEAGDVDAGFTGRYRLGPANAPIRVVIFTSYQCPECQRLEMQMTRILQQRDDVSFSIKHFPLNPDCNPHVPRPMHRNACWAARAAEAAGILRGEDGFWQMHHWLVQRAGAFTDAELQRALREFGYEPQTFLSTMMSDRTLDLVRADAEEGWSLGLPQTPMVFINGVELRGTHASRRIRQAIERIAAESPQAQAPDTDRPLSAVERWVEVWRESQQHDIERDELGAVRAMGPDDAPVTIHMWGDFTHERTALADALVRKLVESRSDVRYEFRVFPVSSDCNPVVTAERTSASCFAARLALAVAAISGGDGYWRMHEWLMRRGPALREADLQDALLEAGLDQPAILQHMDDPSIEEAIVRDAREVERIAERRITPMIFINGRWVERWELDDHDLLSAIVNEAMR